MCLFNSNPQRLLTVSMREGSANSKRLEAMSLEATSIESPCVGSMISISYISSPNGKALRIAQPNFASIDLAASIGVSGGNFTVN